MAHSHLVVGWLILAFFSPKNPELIPEYESHLSQSLERRQGINSKSPENLQEYRFKIEGDLRSHLNKCLLSDLVQWGSPSRFNFLTNDLSTFDNF